MRRALALSALLLLALMALSCGDDVTSLVFSPDRLPGANVGQPYTVTVTVSNNKTPVFQMTIVDGQLPRGLTLHAVRNGSTAEISGVPKVTGTFTFAVTASCFGTNTSGQQGRQSYELVVQ